MYTAYEQSMTRRGYQGLACNECGARETREGEFDTTNDVTLCEGCF
jgi:hypothetical protein